MNGYYNLADLYDRGLTLRVLKSFSIEPDLVDFDDRTFLYEQERIDRYLEQPHISIRTQKVSSKLIASGRLTGDSKGITIAVDRLLESLVCRRMSQSHLIAETAIKFQTPNPTQNQCFLIYRDHFTNLRPLLKSITSERIRFQFEDRAQNYVSRQMLKLIF